MTIKFQYTAKDKDGNPVAGTVEAGDKEKALNKIQELRVQGLTDISVDSAGVVEEVGAVENKENKPLLNKLYKRTLEDPILIPLAWRIWTMIAVAGWAFWKLVIDPVVWVMTRGTPKLCQMDVTFICIGLIITSLCLLTAVRSMRRKNGKNWNKWLKRGTDSTPKP